MSNTCADNDSTRVSYLDGELEELELREFETHVADCPNCRQELEAAMGAHTALRAHLAAPPEASDLLRSRLNLALDQEDRAQGRERRKRWLSWSIPAGASALAAAALLLFVWSDLRTPDSGPAQSSQVTRDTARQHFQDTPFFVSNDPGSVGRSAGNYLNRRVAPPRFSSQQQVRLLGWTPASVNGKQSATIVYEIVNRTGRHEMRVNLVPSQSLDLASHHKSSFNGTNYWVDSAYGVQTVTVLAGESIAYVFSSDLSVKALVGLVTQTDIVNTLRPRKRQQ